MKGGGASVRRGAGLVGAFTMLSRVLGLVREMLQARVVGAGAAQSAFVCAFLLPNLTRRLFGEGALTGAFLPVFKSELENRGREEALKLARAVATMVALLLSAGALLGMALLTAALWRDAPAAATADAPDRVRLTMTLARTMLPYSVFICGAAFGMAMLNATGRFFASSFVPCILNVAWIGALAALWFAPGTSIAAKTEVLAWTVLGAGALQLAFMLVALWRRGLALAPRLRGWSAVNVRLVWKNTGVAAVGAGAQQISTALDQLLAQVAAPWAAASIAYANRLVELPLAVVGTAFGTVLLPALSGAFARSDRAAARAAFASASRDMLTLLLPAAAALAVLAPDITAAFYRGGAFGAGDSARVARALACYAPGLVAFGLNKTLVPWFHAQRDVKTPVRISVAAVVSNAALNALAVFALPVEWRHAGMAAATVATATATTVALGVVAARRGGGPDWPALCMALRPAFFAALAMTLALLALRASPRFASFSAAAADAAARGGGAFRAFAPVLAVEVVAGGAIWLAAFAAFSAFRKTPAEWRFRRVRGAR